MDLFGNPDRLARRSTNHKRRAAPRRRLSIGSGSKNRRLQMIAAAAAAVPPPVPTVQAVAPSPVAATPERTDKEIQDFADDQRRKYSGAGKSGRSGTILTGGAGASNALGLAAMLLGGGMAR